MDTFYVYISRVNNKLDLILFLWKKTITLVAIILPDEHDNGLAYICTGPAGEVTPSTIDPRGKHSIYSYVNGIQTFYRLHLAAGLKEVGQVAKKDAEEDIAGGKPMKQKSGKGINYDKFQ